MAFFYTKTDFTLASNLQLRKNYWESFTIHQLLDTLGWKEPLQKSTDSNLKVNFDDLSTKSYAWMENSCMTDVRKKIVDVVARHTRQKFDINISIRLSTGTHRRINISSASWCTLCAKILALGYHWVTDGFSMDTLTMEYYSLEIGFRHVTDIIYDLSVTYPSVEVKL